jgi:hypothetical protein
MIHVKFLDIQNEIKLFNLQEVHLRHRRIIHRHLQVDQYHREAYSHRYEMIEDLDLRQLETTKFYVLCYR